MCKKGFTLIELLVVISIIALLVSILMPALSKARYVAKRVYCSNNMKSQAMIQHMYLGDNEGRFHSHDDHSAEYLQSNGAKDSLYSAIIGYITDINIMECPIQATMCKNPDIKWLNLYFNNNGAYANWGGTANYAKENNGNLPVNILGGYLWFANYTYFGVEPLFKFTDTRGIEAHEKPWPKKESQATSSVGLIAHRISNQPGQHFWDTGHKGNGLAMNAEFDIFSSDVDNPVAYGDAHVEINMKQDIRPRAKTTSGAGIFYY
ncbi:MAG: prepilin-type N-terminal cleavage/methylation domain-containing protein [Phycisphaerae bacterium]|nr:prepilin-type N-terminal cleavage/methylation domain-containing protein [Phycisphaerae bacterium]